MTYQDDMYQDEMPSPPDGPTPAREQLPLPRRQRQAHLEPNLRAPEGTEPGTPFAAFATDAATDTAAEQATKTADQSDRAAAFHAGAHRGRGTAGPRRRDTDRNCTDR